MKYHSLQLFFPVSPTRSGIFPTRRKSERSGVPRLLLCIASLGAFSGFALAGSPSTTNIHTDGSMGANAAITGTTTSTGLAFTIPSNLGTTSGSNLFHSFSVFNIGNGDSATFTNSGTDSISNIFARVTGGNASTINGALNSNVQGANLYLINPAGIIFGQGASLNVSGSFTASTAHVVNFPDGAVLPTGSPTSPTAASISGLNPSSFGFTASANPIGVSNANLSVPTGQILALVGGNNALNGATLTAPGGHISIVSVAPGATVSFNPTTIHSDPTISSGNASTLQISNSQIATSGDSTGVTPSGSSTIVASDCTFLNSQISNTNYSSSTASGGGIHMFLTDGLTVTGPNSSINTSAIQAGSPGNIQITSANTVNLSNGASIASANSGAGQGGDIDITVTNTTSGSISITTNASISTTTLGNAFVGASGSAAPSSGTGGNLNLSASAITLDGGTGPNGTANTTGLYTLAGTPLLSTGSGSGGNIVATPASSVLGALAGNINVTTSALTVANSASISSVSTNSASGGNISISLPNPLGPSSTLTAQLFAGGTISSFNNGDGPGGFISILATSLSVDGAGTSILVNNHGTSALPIKHTVIDLFGNISLSNNAVIGTISDSPGGAGGITLEGTINITNGASINSTVSGSGNAQPIELDGAIGDNGSVNLLNGGAIISQTIGSGAGASITINAGTVQASGLGADTDLSVHPSGIFAFTGNQAVAPGAIGSPSNLKGGATSNTGAGGSISINVNGLTVSNGALIESYSNSVGNAGGTYIQLTNTGQASILDGGQIRSFGLANGAPGQIFLYSGLVPGQAAGSSGLPDTFVGVFEPSQLVIQNVSNSQNLTGIESDTNNANAPSLGLALQVNKITIANGGFVKSTSNGTGKAADISIQALGSGIGSNGGLSLANYGTAGPGLSTISTSSGPNGVPGAITINAGYVNIDSSSQIQSINMGPAIASPITINSVSSLYIFPDSGNTTTQGIFTSASGSGAGANIDILTGDFAAQGLSLLSTTTSGLGKGGDINLTGVAPNSSSTAVPNQPVNSNDYTGLGRIALNYQADPATPSGIAATSTNNTATGGGAAGSISIQGSRIYLDQGSYIKSIAANSGGGAAGTINIDALSDYLAINANSLVSVSAANGPAGNISLTGANGVYINGSMVTALAPNGPGANITITSPVTDQIINSSIIAQAVGTGAQITIDPPTINIVNSIIRGTLDNNILTAIINGIPFNNSSTFLLDQPIAEVAAPVTSTAASIASSSAFSSVNQSSTNSSSNSTASGTGTQGSQASPRIELSFIENRFLQLSATLQESCGVRLSDDASTFILTGVGGTPVDPKGYLPGYMIYAPTKSAGQHQSKP